MLTSFIRSLFAPPVSDPSELRRFLSGEASYLAQRATYEFSRNTLAWYGQHYFADSGFNAAFRKCRWDSFALLSADMVLMAFGRLAGATHGAHDALAARLPPLYAAILAEYPPPEHRPEGWSGLESEFAARVAAVRLPLDPAELARATAKAVFRTLPVFSENRAGDHQVVYNAVHFGLVAFADRLRRRVAAGPAAEALLAGAALDGARAVSVT
jgi:hypothetical protein